MRLVKYPILTWGMEVAIIKCIEEVIIQKQLIIEFYIASKKISLGCNK